MLKRSNNFILREIYIILRLVCKRDKPFNMAVENLSGVTAQMRAEMGNTGVKGLMKNKKVFFIAMFAS